MILHVISALVLGVFVAESVLLVHAAREAPPFHRVASVLFPVSQAVAICPFVFLALSEDRLDLCAAMLLIAVGCVVSNWFLLTGLRRASKKEVMSAKARVLEDQLAVQDRHFDALLDEASEAEALSADLVAYLQEVKEVVRTSEAGGVSAKLHDMTEVRFPARSRFCQHKVVDALMMAKSEQCEHAGVHLSCQLEVPEDLNIPDPELCAVFSNIVDNAIAACAHVPPDDRSFSLKARYDRGYLVVEGRNSFKEGEGRGKRTHRRNPGEHLSRHGWGLAILRSIAARHDGMVETSQSAGVFTCTVMLAV